MHYRHKDTTRENGRHPCTKFETSQKNQPPHESAATSKFNQSKNNRYQQTWHTIEFSNNRSYRHQTQPNRCVLAPKQLFKPTPTRPIPQIRSQPHHPPKPAPRPTSKPTQPTTNQKPIPAPCTAHAGTTSTLSKGVRHPHRGNHITIR